MGFELTKKKPVTPQQVADLSRQLSAFLRAGIPILRALAVIGQEGASAQVRELVQSIAADLQEGTSFSEAVVRHADVLPTYYPGIVRSAELHGHLDVALDQLADYVDRDQQTKRRVRAALVYPGILAGLAVVTVGVLVGFVLPKFKGFFAGMGAQLPMTTKLLLALGDSVKKYGLRAGTAGVIVLLVLVLLARTERGHLVRDHLALRLPVMRTVVEASVIERFCRILSAMLGGGISISDGMAAAIESSDNRVFAGKLGIATLEMMEGGGFASPIAATGLFPGMVTQMMRVGEDTGTLDEQLEVAANYYERELGFRLEKLTAIFEPAIIVAMGLVVGFVAIALVQAMYGVYGQTPS